MSNKKINLAVLNKKKEEIDKKEMHEVHGGALCDGACTVIFDNTSATSMRQSYACPCASLWVVFGLS